MDIRPILIRRRGVAKVRSAWTVFKARQMRGAEDRGDLYRFWYHSWQLQPGENPLKGWWAIKVVESGVAKVFPVGGNLVVTDQRLLWEPMRNGRASYGPHGIKLIVNLAARAQDAMSPRVPLAWPLNQFTLETSESRQAPVWIVPSGDARTGFYFADGPIFPGSREKRADFMNQTRDAQQSSQRPMPRGPEPYSR